MQARHRSLFGAAMAVFALPVFVGLTACLPTFPVPVGNPEKSTIDPAISGVWVGEDATFWVFEPYDKRTWLITAFEISLDTESCPQDAGVDEEPEAAADWSDYDAMMAEIATLGSDCFDADREPGAIKAWRARFGGEWFMTWETKGAFDAEKGFEPQEWIVWHIDTSVPGELRLGMIDTEHEAFAKITDMEEEDITQRDVEKVFRRHADEEGFYAVEEDDGVLLFQRVQPEHYELIAGFIDYGMLD